MMHNNGFSKLVEELGELLQAVGKYQAYPDGPHPDGGPPLTVRIEEEMGDVLAAIRLVCGAHESISLERVEDRAALKLEKFEQWHYGATSGAALRDLMARGVAWLDAPSAVFEQAPGGITACPGYHAWKRGYVSDAE